LTVYVKGDMEVKGRLLGYLVFFLLSAYFVSRVAMSLVKLQGHIIHQTISIVELLLMSHYTYMGASIGYCGTAPGEIDPAHPKRVRFSPEACFFAE
jgi:hypothetical protein